MACASPSSIRAAGCSHAPARSAVATSTQYPGIAHATMKASRARSIACCSPAMRHRALPYGLPYGMWGAPVDTARDGKRSAIWFEKSGGEPSLVRAAVPDSIRRREPRRTRRRTSWRAAGPGARDRADAPAEPHARRDAVRHRGDDRVRSAPVVAHPALEPRGEHGAYGRRPHRAAHSGHEGTRRAGSAGAQLRHAARPPAGVHELSADARHEAVARAAHAADDRQLVARQPELGGKAAGSRRRATSSARAAARTACTRFSPRSAKRRASSRSSSTRSACASTCASWCRTWDRPISRRSSRTASRRSCPKSRCLVEGSPDLIAQLLDKLMDNASDFTPQGGPITIVLARGPRSCTLTRAQRGAAPAAAAGQPTVRVARHAAAAASTASRTSDSACTSCG